MVRRTSHFKVSDSIENIDGYEEAIKSQELYVIHHRLETHKFDKKTKTWKEREYSIPSTALEAAGLYSCVPSWQLVFMTVAEHVKLHNRLRKWKQESRNKIAQSNHKRINEFLKTSDNCKGSRWYTNGIVSKRIHEGETIPTGFRRGRK